jgi:hypothetical protein
VPVSQAALEVLRQERQLVASEVPVSLAALEVLRQEQP